MTLSVNKGLSGFARLPGSGRKGATLFGRPNLFTSYERESRIFTSTTQKVVAAVVIVVLFLMPFELPVINQIPIIRFLGDGEYLRPVSTTLVYIIAALGLNLLLGVAGQVSIGHAFFMGAGAYAAAFLGGEATSTVYGHGLPIWIWLPGAGITAAAIGVLIAPVAVRLRGLYLAIVTLGLVFIGIHMGNMDWGRKFAGDPGLGRDFPPLELALWKGQDPIISAADDGRWLWFDITKAEKIYLVLLCLTLFMVVLAKNIIRSRTGRALQAIRDRDVAAEVMGIPEFKYKVIAFALSSFFAGIGGALLGSLVGKLPAIEWDLFLSVEFVAILLIGGLGTISGTVLGAIFVVLGPRLIEEVTKWLESQTEATGPVAAVADLIVTEGANDFGPVSTATQSPGWPMSIFSWNVVIYGLLIVVFLIFEPLGLYGIWLNIKSYFKRWPFSY
jgi:branched-chain amino acid transport system permease protein